MGDDPRDGVLPRRPLRGLWSPSWCCGCVGTGVGKVTDDRGGPGGTGPGGSLSSLRTCARLAGGEGGDQRVAVDRRADAAWDRGRELLVPAARGGVCGA